MSDFHATPYFDRYSTELRELISVASAVNLMLERIFVTGMQAELVILPLDVLPDIESIYDLQVIHSNVPNMCVAVKVE